MIADEERIVEGGQSADHIETGVLDFLNTGLVFLLRVVGVGIRCGRILAEDLGIVADGRAIHDVDDEGVDLCSLRVGNVGVDVSQYVRVAGQVQRIDMLRHDVIFKARLLSGIIVEALAVAASKAVRASGVNHIDAEAVIGLYRSFLRAGSVLA